MGIEYDISGRQSGKTTKSLAWLAEGSPLPHWPFWDRVLIVFSAHEAQRLVDLGLISNMCNHRGREHTGIVGVDTAPASRSQIMTAEEWTWTRKGRGRTLHSDIIDVAVDNLDIVLQHWLGNVVKATSTGAVSP